MDVNEFLQYITGLPDYEGQIEHVQYLPSSEPAFADLKQPLHPSLESALREQGCQRFFSHQALAIDAALAGENVMVSTSSASGKTMCYNVPVLQSLLHDRSARALYLFPTKALAQDQLRSLRELASGTTGHRRICHL